MPKPYISLHITGVLYRVSLCSAQDHFILSYPDSKVHGANMGPTCGWQDPSGPHAGPMNFAIWLWSQKTTNTAYWAEVDLTHHQGWGFVSIVIVQSMLYGVVLCNIIHKCSKSFPCHLHTFYDTFLAMCGNEYVWIWHPSAHRACR